MIMGEIRGLFVTEDYLYAVKDGYVFKIETDDTKTYLGELNTTTGPVTMASNGLEVMIVDGTDGYIVTIASDAFAEISDTDFPGAGAVTYQDGYFLVNDPGTGDVYISGSYDGTSWGALDYGTAEAKPDDVSRPFSAYQEVWLFGVDSTEVWYNSGDSDFPFERMAGGVIEHGLKAVHSVSKLDNGIAWLSDKGQVLHARGYNPVVISTPQIEYQLAQYSDLTDGIGFYYTMEGHEFYVLTFPTDAATWCFDATTGFWHERSSYLTVSTTGRWRANCYAFFNSKHLVGDFTNGKVYEVDLGTYTDNYHSIQRIRTATAIHNDRKRVFHHRLEVEFEAGVGVTNPTTTAYAAGTTYDAGDYVTSGGKYYISLLGSNVGNTPATETDYWEEIEAAVWTGNDPQCVMDYSNDGGHTFSNTKTTDIGVSAAYTNRAVFRRLGKARDRVYRITMTAPVKTIILSADLEATAGMS
jgi:hypothetical protein